MLVGQGFKEVMLAVVRSHHEMLDGSGYPNALQGGQIPDLVRLVTVCDIYGALIERRPYRAPMAGEKAYAILDGMAGRLDALAFYDFPAEHWDHLRSSNPIESVFATVRHRTVRTKGALSATTAKLMVFKLVIAASKTWRRLKGENQLPKVVAGVIFRDGTEVTASPDHRAA